MLKIYKNTIWIQLGQDRQSTLLFSIHSFFFLFFNWVIYLGGENEKGLKVYQCFCIAHLKMKKTKKNPNPLTKRI